MDDNAKDETSSKNLGGSTPKPPIRRRRTSNKTADAANAEPQKVQENVESCMEKTTTISTVKHSEFTKTTKATSNQQFVQEIYEADATTPDSPSQQLRQKVARFEKVWSSGGGMKRSSEQTPEELRHELFFSIDDDNDDNSLFEIDVFEIEKRLREERQRGLAEAEAAKFAFQQVHLRHSTPEPTAQRVEIREEHTASPFHVTLKTSTKLTPSPEHGRIPEPPPSPFNVTLRTTRRKQRAEMERDELKSNTFNVNLRKTTMNTSPVSTIGICDGKKASAKLLANEQTVREVQTGDGVRTIVTSSGTSDGRCNEERIFRHGAGYISPRNSPQRAFKESEASIPRSASPHSSGRSSVTPPRSVDMTAGGRRILIKFADELNRTTDNDEMEFDETDNVKARIKKYQKLTADVHSSTFEHESVVDDSDVAMGTSPNIDIKVGSGNLYYGEQSQQQQLLQQEQSKAKEGSRKKQVTVETISPPQQQLKKIPWQTENNKNNKTITTTTITTKTKSSIKQTESDIEHSIEKSTRSGTRQQPQQKAHKENLNVTISDISDESDTEGVAASKLVIVPVKKQQQEDQLNTSVGRNIIKGLNCYQQIPQQQNTSNNKNNYNSNEFQEFQSTMAAKSFTRSNSQYDSHIRELRGNYIVLFFFF